MLKYNYGFLCDVAYVASDGKISVLGIFDSISARKFPVVHGRMVIFAHWRGDEGAYPVTLKLIDPYGKDVIKPLKLRVNIHRGGSRANMIAELNQVNFQSPGNYLVEIAVEGQEDKAVVPLPVNQIQ